MEGPKSAALAVVDNDKCVACFRCVDICADDALLAPERSEPKVFGLDMSNVDMAAINDLINRAEIDPNRAICPCSSTMPQEVAAAILQGADTMEDLALHIRLAFGGGVRLQDLTDIQAAGAEAVDVGRDILNAPLLDLRMRIIE